MSNVEENPAGEEWKTRSILGGSIVGWPRFEATKINQRTHDIKRNLNPGFPSENDYDSKGLVFTMVKLFILLFRPPDIMFQMDHERYCAAIHLFNIRIARYFLSILHIHGEFVFISVALFISPFPPQEIMYPRRCSATILFFQRLNSEVQSIFSILHGGHSKIHNSPGESRWARCWCDLTRHAKIASRALVRDLPPYKCVALPEIQILWEKGHTLEHLIENDIYLTRNKPQKSRWKVLEARSWGRCWHTAHARSVNGTIKPKNQVAIYCPQIDEYNARSDDTVPFNHPWRLWST